MEAIRAQPPLQLVQFFRGPRPSIWVGSYNYPPGATSAHVDINLQNVGPSRRRWLRPHCTQPNLQSMASMQLRNVRVVALVALVACSSSSTWHPAVDVSSCATLYRVIAPGQTISLGGCTARLSPNAPQVLAIPVDRTFTIASTIAFHGQPLMATPISGNPKIVRVVDGQRVEGETIFRTFGAGSTLITTDDRVCGLPSPCPMLRVQVTER